MAASPGSTITEHFATLTDPRVERTKEHQLLDHPHHCLVRDHQRRRRVGGDGGVRQGQAGMARDLPPPPQRHSLA